MDDVQLSTIQLHASLLAVLLPLASIDFGQILQ